MSSILKWILGLAQVESVRAGTRASQDVNELANSCFFTYRLTFKLCPEQSDKALCNKQFGVNGADFQHRMWNYYSGEGPPLLEESSWMMNMFPTDADKDETLKECPAIIILSYLTIAESQLFLQDIDVGKSLAVQALHWANTRPEHIGPTMRRSWPIDQAFERFQFSMRMSYGSRELYPYGTSMDVVICRCGESLDFLVDKNVWNPVPRTVYIIYNKCTEFKGDANLAEGVKHMVWTGQATVIDNFDG